MVPDLILISNSSVHTYLKTKSVSPYRLLMSEHSLPDTDICERSMGVSDLKPTHDNTMSVPMQGQGFVNLTSHSGVFLIIFPVFDCFRYISLKDPEHPNPTFSKSKRITKEI